MDYYEELGIERSATKEDISQAHRRLTKLLHPDQQTDEAIKVLADKQMRRLNSIVEVLVDPERRFRYDQHLQFLSITKNPRPAENQFRPILVPRQRFEWMPSRKSILLSLSSAAVGAILMMCALLLWTNDWGGSTYEERRQLSAEAESNPAGTASPQPLSASAERPAAEHPAIDRATSPRYEPGPPSAAGTGATVATATRPAETKPLLAQNTSPHQPAAQTSTPPPQAQKTPPVKTTTSDTKQMVSTAPSKPSSSSTPKEATNTAATAGVQRPKNVLEGYWVYNPPKRENSDPGYYVPEFIHLKLSSKGDGLQGNYEARYAGVPKSISPTVRFSLSTSDRQSQRFIWQSASGSRGTFHVSLLDPDKVRIDWRTTVSSPQQGLTSGVATLVRQNP